MTDLECLADRVGVKSAVYVLALAVEMGYLRTEVPPPTDNPLPPVSSHMRTTSAHRSAPRATDKYHPIVLDDVEEKSAALGQR